nr:MAG TPA: hypothetical protein [Caudoviricetes sp.]
MITFIKTFLHSRESLYSCSSWLSFLLCSNRILFLFFVSCSHFLLLFSLLVIV